MASESGKITTLLNAWRRGDKPAGDELIVLLYQELRRMAGHYMKDERPGHTLEATGLVHELYLQMLAGQPAEWRDRAHFLAVAARQLRHMLIDHARSRRAQKRGGPQIRLGLEDADGLTLPAGEHLFALDEALTRLEQLDQRAARIVELKFFGGLTDQEAAAVLDVSLSTVKRDWDFARTWLLSRLTA